MRFRVQLCIRTQKEKPSTVHQAIPQTVYQTVADEDVDFDDMSIRNLDDTKIEVCVHYCAARVSL